jgi:hypothetical protein
LLRIVTTSTFCSVTVPDSTVLTSTFSPLASIGPRTTCPAFVVTTKGSVAVIETTAPA